MAPRNSRIRTRLTTRNQLKTLSKLGALGSGAPGLKDVIKVANSATLSSIVISSTAITLTNNILQCNLENNINLVDINITSCSVSGSISLSDFNQINIDGDSVTGNASNNLNFSYFTGSLISGNQWTFSGVTGCSVSGSFNMSGTTSFELYPASEYTPATQFIGTVTFSGNTSIYLDNNPNPPYNNQFTGTISLVGETCVIFLGNQLYTPYSSSIPVTNMNLNLTSEAININSGTVTTVYS